MRAAQLWFGAIAGIIVAVGVLTVGYDIALGLHFDPPAGFAPPSGTFGIFTPPARLWRAVGWWNYTAAGNWFLFFEHGWMALTSPQNPVGLAAGISWTAAAALLGLLAIPALAFLDNPAASASRKELSARGASILRREDAAPFVRDMILRGFNQTLLQRLWWSVTALPRPLTMTAKRVRIDAREQDRAVTRQEAQGDAEISNIGLAAAHWLGSVRLGNVPMPPKREMLHTLICGTTGTGKTVALRALLEDIRRRGDRTVVIDAGYNLMPAFCRDGDLLLSATDPDSLGWDLRNEATSPDEWATWAGSICAVKGSGESAQWMAKARDFLADICIQVGAESTNRDLFEIATQYDVEALQGILAGTASYAALADGGSSYLSSVRSNLGTGVKNWGRAKGGDFSVRAFMQDTTSAKWLWLPYSDATIGTSAPAIAAWMDIAITGGLSRAESAPGPATWLIIDELDSIGTLPMLKKAVTRLRKYRVSVVAAIQDYSQLVATYGPEDAATLYANLSNKLFLRCGDSLAEKISQDIGDTERRELQTQRSRGLQARGSSSNLSATDQYRTERGLLPSEISGLPDRVGYVKFGGVPQVIPAYLPDYRPKGKR
jgi:hypothetical protein